MQLYLDHDWISPYSFAAFVALTEKAVPFTLMPLFLAKGEHQRPAYAKSSLTGKIPCLVDGDFWLPESAAIVEYLEEKFPAPAHNRLLPVRLADRARARMIMAWVRSDLMPLREERPTTTMFYQKADKPLSKSGEEAAAKLLAVAGELIPNGKTQLFDTWSSADADLAFMLQRLVMNGHKVDSKIGNFVEAQWSRPSVRAFASKKRPTTKEMP